MLDPSVVDAIAGLGSLGFAIIAVYALVARKVHPDGAVRERIATDAERLAELRADRDEWRSLAKSFGAKVDRLTDVVELLGGRKVGDV